MRLGNLHLEVGLVQATGLESMIYLGWELLCVAYITVLRMSQCISHFDLVPTLHSTFLLFPHVLCSVMILEDIGGW